MTAYINDRLHNLVINSGYSTETLCGFHILTSHCGQVRIERESNVENYKIEFSGEIGYGNSLTAAMIDISRKLG